MRVITLIVMTAFVPLAALVLIGGCTSQITQRPVATRPSLTIFPVQMAGQPREDVAATIALMLEQRGMESIEVDGAVFTPDADAAFDDHVAAFTAFVRERDLTTDYALYGAVVGSSVRGVDEIHGVLVDQDGTVAWSDRATRESPAMKRSKPADPMSCTVFLVERLVAPLDLLAPTRVNASEGRWANYWRTESLAPAEDELEEMQTRLERLIKTRSAAKVLVYPARTGDAWSVECATRIVDAINREGLLDASLGEGRIDFESQPARNQQRVLWSGARSIRHLVRTNPREADYVLLTDYLLARGSGEAIGVHTFLLEADGDWVIVDYQNSHHDDFNRVRPRSLEGCCDLTVVRLRRHLGV